MSKAAMQRKIKRLKYLARLAKEDPKRFEEEWGKRLSSWLKLIVHEAGMLRDENGRAIPAVFERTNEVLTLLACCGKDVYRQYAHATRELLNTECCRQLAFKVDKRLHRLNSYVSPIQE